jgi:ABC-type molybdate transport system ATPase subunit
LGDYAAQNLDPDEHYLLDIAAEGLGFDPALDPATASGGERRRAALARLLAEAPELMLLTSRQTTSISTRSPGLRLACAKPARLMC